MNAFRFLPTAICQLLAAFMLASGPFPADGAVAGAKPSGQLTFTGADLYGYINGGAELFLEFGFEELKVQKYATPDGEVALDLYRMESAEGALGIFLAKRGKETPVRGIKVRNTGDRYQITALQGRYFVQASNFKGGEGGSKLAVDLLNSLTAALPDSRTGDPFAAFPKDRRMEGTEVLFLGPYALQRLFTFGDGDILLQKEMFIGAAMDYIDAGKNIYTLYRVQYPDAEFALQGFAHLRDNLDPTITVTDNKEKRIVFRDFAGKYGSAQLDGAILWLRTGLAGAPAN